jgi:CheY-like chemotaxis protein
VRISVEDTGIGLSENDKVRVFAEFEQADETTYRQRGGTGLGLAICTRLARAMNGAITLESDLGKGSTFKVDLELVIAAGAADPLVVDESVARNLVILLVSDRVLERRTLARVLEDRNVQSIEATAGTAAKEIERAVDRGAPVNRLVIDNDVDSETAGQLLMLARRAARDAGSVQGLVLVSILARGSLSAFRAHGFTSYLVRPVRPADFLVHLGAARSAHDVRSVATPYSEGAVADVDQELETCRILLAEDNPINALLARRVIEKLGSTVVLVENGEEAVEAVHRAFNGDDPTLSLILMDVRMPQLDGFEATLRIRDMYERAGRSHQRPPIIAMTANAFAEDREQCIAAGMDDYLAKPFDVSMLRDIIGRWLGADAVASDCGRPAA